MTQKSEKIKKTIGSGNELIYDTEGFTHWCVNIQGKSTRTPQSYLSSIRTAFASQFDIEMDNPFLNLQNAFRNLRRKNEESFARLEFEFNALKGYKEMIEKYGDGDIIISDDGEIKDAPIETWISALRMYLKYLRSKIDRLRQLNGLPLTISDDKEMFMDLPLTKEFRQYLKSLGKGYTRSSVDSICCRLRRLYNLFLRRRLKVDVMPDLKKYIDEGHSLKPFLQAVEAEINYEDGSLLAPELTAEDFSRGKAAFSLYREFIEAYSLHPDKYHPERYTNKKIKSMNTESNKVLLVGIGKTGLGTIQIIRKNKVKGITTLGINKESQLQLLYAQKIQEAELVILVADLGSEKENSLALKAATLGKEKGKVVATILTTPPLSEGEKAVMGALEAAGKISREVDSSLIINKETVNSLPKEECSLDELFYSLVAVEDTIADGINNIMALISEEGEIKIDVQDLKTALAESGTFTIESGFGTGENRVENAIEQILSSPLVKKCDISTARRVLIKLFPPKNTPLTMEEMNLTMEEMKEVSGFIKTLPSHADVKWGVGESDYDDILSIIILASGFDVKLP